MKALDTLLRMTPQERKLVVKAVITLALCGMRMRVQGFGQLKAWAIQSGNGTTPAEQLAWAMKVASRRVPGNTCLSQALSLQHLLSRNGHCSELRIGVGNSDGRFTAHAWLTLNDRVLIGGSVLENYKLLAMWSTRGGLVHDAPRGPSSQ
jgi:Transglutaminase-like superfamily